jgi:hypothetical protein
MNDFNKDKNASLEDKSVNGGQNSPAKGEPKPEKTEADETKKGSEKAPQAGNGR